MLSKNLLHPILTEQFSCYEANILLCMVFFTKEKCDEDCIFTATQFYAAFHVELCPSGRI
jgi:hypothetical protein